MKAYVSVAHAAANCSLLQLMSPRNMSSSSPAASRERRLFSVVTPRIEQQMAVHELTVRLPPVVRWEVRDRACREGAQRVWRPLPRSFRAHTNIFPPTVEPLW